MSLLLRNAQVFLGFFITGFANTVLPTLIFSAAYLIIPYPRATVIVLQGLPSVIAKLFLPQLLVKLPYRYRSAALALGWIVSTIIINSSTPNVRPAPRIFAVALASTSATLGEITWLGLLRYHGRLGLSGWSIGTGLGAVVCAILPYALTVQMGLLLRVGLGYAWYLVPLLVLSHNFIIPYDGCDVPGAMGLPVKDDIEKHISSPGRRSMVGNLLQTSTRYRVSSKEMWRLLHSLTKPYVVPLALCGIGQAAAFPGFSRAMGVSSPFPTYSSYIAVYGVVFQAGNLAARALFSLSKPPRAKSGTGFMLLALLVLFFNTSLLFTAAPLFTFSLVGIVGFAVGLVYVGTFSAAIEQTSYMSGINLEIGLGFISVGESAGLIIGGICGAVLEGTMCGGTGSAQAHGTRWCFV